MRIHPWSASTAHIKGQIVRGAGTVIRNDTNRRGAYGPQPCKYTRAHELRRQHPFGGATRRQADMGKVESSVCWRPTAVLVYCMERPSPRTELMSLRSPRTDLG